LQLLVDGSKASRQGLADFPIEAERIVDSTYAPTLLVADWPNPNCSGTESPFETGIRIFHDHDYSHRTTARGFAAQIEVFRRLVSKPEFGSPHRDARHDCSIFVVQTAQIDGSEGHLIELDRCKNRSKPRAPRRTAARSIGGELSAERAG
jgi:hypothetical protein